MERAKSVTQLFSQVYVFQSTKIFLNKLYNVLVV